MDTKTYISVSHLCTQYQITEQLFKKFHDTGLLKIITIEEKPCITIKSIQKVEKILRLHQDLKVNPEGIDVILNLLKKIDTLSSEVVTLQRKLEIYKNE
jgi:hypothetical protein